MNFIIASRVALRSLMRNKVRAMLTMLGIIIGIAAVIAVISVGEGATVMVKEQIQTLGNNILMVFPGSSSRGGFNFGVGSKATLTAHDGEVILNDCPFVKALTPVVIWGGQIIYRNKNCSSTVQGVTPSNIEIRNWDVDEGDFFGDTDVRAASRVCVIGRTLVNQLFGVENPIGRIMWHDRRYLHTLNLQISLTGSP